MFIDCSEVSIRVIVTYVENNKILELSGLGVWGQGLGDLRSLSVPIGMEKIL